MKRWVDVCSASRFKIQVQSQIWYCSPEKQKQGIVILQSKFFIHLDTIVAQIKLF